MTEHQEKMVKTVQEMVEKKMLTNFEASILITTGGVLEALMYINEKLALIAERLEK